jgi:hypothetical protein
MIVKDAIKLVAPHVEVITLDLKTYDNPAGERAACAAGRLAAPGPRGAAEPLPAGGPICRRCAAGQLAAAARSLPRLSGCPAALLAAVRGRAPR